MKGEKVKKDRKVGFCIRTDPGSKVFVAGTFNNWNATQYRMRDNPDDGVFKVSLTLPPGDKQPRPAQEASRAP